MDYMVVSKVAKKEPEGMDYMVVSKVAKKTGGMDYMAVSKAPKLETAAAPTTAVPDTKSPIATQTAKSGKSLTTTGTGPKTATAVPSIPPLVTSKTVMETPETKVEKSTKTPPKSKKDEKSTKDKLPAAKSVKDVKDGKSTKGKDTKEPPSKKGKNAPIKKHRTVMPDFAARRRSLYIKMGVSLVCILVITAIITVVILMLVLGGEEITTPATSPRKRSIDITMFHSHNHVFIRLFVTCYIFR